ncbi:hypothetical protein DID77_03935, partial [Candidatus Marinamargulisbacteria bacterium SCGC AG-439-L15]
MSSVPAGAAGAAGGPGATGGAETHPASTSTAKSVANEHATAAKAITTTSGKGGPQPKAAAPTKSKSDAVKAGRISKAKRALKSLQGGATLNETALQTVAKTIIMGSTDPNNLGLSPREYKTKSETDPIQTEIQELTRKLTTLMQNKPEVIKDLVKEDLTEDNLPQRKTQIENKFKEAITTVTTTNATSTGMIDKKNKLQGYGSQTL